MSIKYHTITQRSPRHFSEWVTPKTKDYKLACCDCGLVHDMQFMVMGKDGQRLDARKAHIKFRVRRNEQETKRERRNKKSA